MNTTPLTSLASQYRREGLSFFPLPYKAKRDDSFKWGVYQERQPTENEVKSWFNGHQKNIAVVCGKVSGNLVVVEFDNEDYFVEFEVNFLNKQNMSILDFTRVSKGKRGPHIWLRVKHPVKSKKFPKCEIRSDGNYIVVPPSVHPDGPEYQFLSDLPIREIESLAEVGINIEQQRKDAQSTNQPGWVTQLLQGVSEGQRNDSAIRLAGYFRNVLPIDVTERILLDWNSRNTPPLPAGELQQAIKNSYGYPPHPLNNELLNYCPNIESVDTQRYRSVTESVTKSRAEQIEDWVKETTGWFSYEDIDKEFGIRTEAEKLNRRVIIKRLKDAGKIESHPKNNRLLRYIIVTTRLIDFKSALKRTPIAVTYPFGIEQYFNTYPGNLVVIAGAADAGKTALLLNFIKLNQFDFTIYYQSSEMGKEELASRLVNFEDITLDEWNFNAEERSTDFADVIRPDCINIIDYMELTGDFYNVAEYLRQIHDKLASGICIVALQKKRNAELGRGGDFGLEKPRLYLTMDAGKLTIQKAKNWTNPEVNPNRLVTKFKIVGGCKFIVSEDWHKEEEPC